MRIPKVCFWLTMTFALGLHGPCSYGDLIADALDEAKDKYHAEIAECHDLVAKFLEKRESQLRARGDKAALDELVLVRAEFESSGLIPDIALRTLKSRVSRAISAMAREFEKAVQDYTRADNDTMAASVQRESKTFFRCTDAKLFGSNYYKVLQADVSWEQAALYCQQIKGRMVVINSPDENDFVTRLGKEVNLDRVWIGITDRQKEGEWVWVDGSKPSFSKWHRWGNGHSEPNDFNGEDYGMLSIVEGGDWHDVPNSYIENVARGFVCEWAVD
ncbi:C-type lectin domain-containing protein [Neorhodopirellula pilleata]|uniref:Lectin C-type domain protein n=1 Tax=Neorhodopirellula pilleata TaxID=2714738 RepID=A0A5C6A6I6_9BACT|nr:C-type lectin domain-containing protein [Neorhodopirellula pilleata]TWT95129.1 Lectin C-type domain protein [Neorhodopirellula pilleata]